MGYSIFLILSMLLTWEIFVFDLSFSWFIIFQCVRTEELYCSIYTSHFILFYLSLDTREASFVSAITAAGVTYAVTRACTMGDLVECSCDKNRLLRRLHYSTSGDNSHDDTSPITTTAIISHGQEQKERDRRRQRRGRRQRHRNNQNDNNNNNNIDDNLLRNRNIYRNVVVPDGDWEWGGCGDNVNFGFRKSKDFLDSRYRRRSDIKTLVKLHNNNAGRLVSNECGGHRETRSIHLFWPIYSVCV